MNDNAESKMTDQALLMAVLRDYSGDALVVEAMRRWERLQGATHRFHTAQAEIRDLMRNES